MCSINGFISFKKYLEESSKDRIKNIILAAEQRGKDSFGYLTLTEDGYRMFKYPTAPSRVLNERFFVEDNVYLLLNNNRAEPTTRFVEDKTEENIQPFMSNKCFVAHNGIIANDKELKEKFGIKTKTLIDSAVIGYLFDNVGKNDYEKAVSILRDELIGSYAVAIYNKETETLYLATNYKPLTIAYDRSESILFFSSLEGFMKDSNINSVFDNMNYQEVPPYTLLVIHKGDKEIKQFSLYKEKDNKKALVIASAGLDSTVCAAWAKHNGYDITLLHYNYGCRANEKEKEHIQMLKEFFGCELVNIEADFFKNVIGGSRLTDSKSEINKEGGGKAGAELAYEWVPARNLIFLSLAAGYAEAKGIGNLILGGNLEESGCLLNERKNKVALANGKFKMPKSIKTGDRLKSWNETKKCIEETVVTELYKPIHTRYYKITCIDIKKRKKVQFTTSKEHPFYVLSKGFVEAQNLAQGNLIKNRIRNQTSYSLYVTEVEVIKEKVQTYNYHCSPNNNFFIGKAGALVHNSYADNELIFQKKFGELLPFALNLQKRVNVLTPVADLMKKDIVELGLKVGAPLSLTWSCYENGKLHCGKCGPCYMRKKAFEILGQPEVIEYEK